MQHDVDYGVCSNRNEKYGENEKNCKHKADKKNGEGSRRMSVETKAVGICGSKEHN